MAVRVSICFLFFLFELFLLASQISADEWRKPRSLCSQWITLTSPTLSTSSISSTSSSTHLAYGKGPVNPKGLQYYNNLTNELTSQGIQAHITLQHWDFRMNMEDGKDFTAYADVCFREFGDRVKYWTTVNEGNGFAIGGYDAGYLTPQRCSLSLIFNCSRCNSSTEPYL